MDKSALVYLIICGIIGFIGFYFGAISGYILGAIGAVCFLFTAFFFRDPKRIPPEDSDAIVSPADGVIVSIDEVDDPDIPDAQRIAIFMSPLNVHVNRTSTDGKVIDIKRYPGCFRRAYLSEASLENERVEILLETPKGNVRIKQIAGIIARRIVCRAKVGDSLVKGQKFGLIHFGSRVELVLPSCIELTVSLKQKVFAGETIVARWK